MRRLLPIVLLCFVGLLPARLEAAPVFDVTPGDLTLTIVTETADPTNVVGYDIRGSAIINVFDPGFVGGLFLTDGTILGAPAPPVPNSFLIGASGDGTQGGLVTTSNPAFGGPGATLTGVFTPLTPLTDPGLVAFAASSPYLFGFTFVDAFPAGQVGELTASVWALSTVTRVPEPAMLALLGVGLAYGLRRRLAS